MREGDNWEGRWKVMRKEGRSYVVGVDVVERVIEIDVLMKECRVMGERGEMWVDMKKYEGK